MIRDADLLDRLAAFPTEAFSGHIFRATRQSIDPVAASTSGGRWMPTGGASVLYTSLTREGALAEISLPNPPEQAGLTARAVALGDLRRAVALSAERDRLARNAALVAY